MGMTAVASFWLITFLNREESLFRKSKRIQIGMTQEEVQTLIGRPSDLNPVSTGTTRQEAWYDDEALLAVAFDENGGRVNEIRFFEIRRGMVSHLWAKIRVFFGLSPPAGRVQPAGAEILVQSSEHQSTN
jgi:hypothetical protein